MGKNNLLLALKELQAEGLEFNLTYSRGPFFLNGSQEEIDSDRAAKGLPKDANYRQAYFQNGKPPPWERHMDQLMSDAGLSPRNTAVTYERVSRCSMDAHRLAQYAPPKKMRKANVCGLHCHNVGSWARIPRSALCYLMIPNSSVSALSMRDSTCRMWKECSAGDCH